MDRLEYIWSGKRVEGEESFDFLAYVWELGEVGEVGELVDKITVAINSGDLVCPEMSELARIFFHGEALEMVVFKGSDNNRQLVVFPKEWKLAYREQLRRDGKMTLERNVQREYQMVRAAFGIDAEGEKEYLGCLKLDENGWRVSRLYDEEGFAVEI